MRRSNCAGALQYVPELTWILFLRILDERETREAEAAEAVGAEYLPSLEAPYRWQDWAAPPDCRLPIGDLRLKETSDANSEAGGFYPGWKRKELFDGPPRRVLRLRQQRFDSPP